MASALLPYSYKFSRGIYFVGPRILQFHFEYHWFDCVNNHKQNEFQRLDFCGMHVIRENSKIYVPQKFLRVR